MKTQLLTLLIGTGLLGGAGVASAAPTISGMLWSQRAEVLDPSLPSATIANCEATGHYPTDTACSFGSRYTAVAAQRLGTRNLVYLTGSYNGSANLAGLYACYTNRMQQDDGVSETCTVISAGPSTSPVNNQFSLPSDSSAIYRVRVCTSTARTNCSNAVTDDIDIANYNSAHSTSYQVQFCTPSGTVKQSAPYTAYAKCLWVLPRIDGTETDLRNPTSPTVGVKRKATDTSGTDQPQLIGQGFSENGSGFNVSINNTTGFAASSFGVGYTFGETTAAPSGETGVNSSTVFSQSVFQAGAPGIIVNNTTVAYTSVTAACAAGKFSTGFACNLFPGNHTSSVGLQRVGHYPTHTSTSNAYFEVWSNYLEPTIPPPADTYNATNTCTAGTDPAFWGSCTQRGFVCIQTPMAAGLGGSSANTSHCVDTNVNVARYLRLGSGSYCATPCDWNSLAWGGNQCVAGGGTCSGGTCTGGTQTGVSGACSTTSVGVNGICYDYKNGNIAPGTGNPCYNSECKTSQGLYSEDPFPLDPNTKTYTCQ